ncbi:MAG: NAD(P)/FAD-dependent oxidoreductase [Cyclobacteriaceae bacterium]
MLRIGVIGGGAAGFFAGIHAADSGHKVIVFEKSSKVLSKVRISGGGRCNVTHSSYTVAELARGYPRGEKFLKKVFSYFGVRETMAWFEENGFMKITIRQWH